VVAVGHFKIILKDKENRSWIEWDEKEGWSSSGLEFGATCATTARIFPRDPRNATTLAATGVSLNLVVGRALDLRAIWTRQPWV
jgi:hypothetical protein